MRSVDAGNREGLWGLEAEGGRDKRLECYVHKLFPVALAIAPQLGVMLSS